MSPTTRRGLVVASAGATVVAVGLAAVFATGAFDGSGAAGGRGTTSSTATPRSTSAPTTDDPVAVQRSHDIGDAAPAMLQYNDPWSAYASTLHTTIAAAQEAVNRNDVGGLRTAVQPLRDAAGALTNAVAAIHFPSTTRQDIDGLQRALGDERDAIAQILDANADVHSALAAFNAAVQAVARADKQLRDDMLNLAFEGFGAPTTT